MPLHSDDEENCQLDEESIVRRIKASERDLPEFRRSLERLTGESVAEVLFQAGYRDGAAYARRLWQQYPLSPPPAFLKHLLKDKLPTILGKFILNEDSLENGWTVIQVDNAFEARAYLQIEVCATRSHCDYLRGALAGLSQICSSSRETLYAIETECMAKGDSCCRFIVGTPSRLAAKGLLRSGKPESDQFRRESLMVLNEIASSYSSDIPTFLDKTLDRTLETLRMEAGIIRLFTEDGNHLKLVCRRGVEFSAEPVIPVLGTVVGEAVRQGQSVVINDLASYSDAGSRIAQEQGFRAMAAFPLRVRDEVLGVFNVATRGERIFTPSEIEFLTAVTHHIGVVLENARLLDEARDQQKQLENAIHQTHLEVLMRNEELTLLNRFASVISRAFNYQKLLSEACPELLNLLGFDSFCVYLNHPEEKQAKLAIVRGSGSRLVRKYASVVPYGQGLAGKVCESGEPIIFSRFDEVSDLAPHPKLKSLPLKIMISLPLRARDQVVAVMNLSSKKQREITEQDRRILDAVSNMLGVAIHNALLYEKTRKSEQEYIHLYEHAPDMYHSLDEIGRIINCNRTEARALGYSKQRLIGWQWQDLFLNEYRDAITDKLSRLSLKQIRSFSLEAVLKRKNGESLEVSIRAVGQYAGERYTGTRVVMRDITAQKQLERQLIQAQKMESLGTLAGGVAHDFNNLLTGMIGYAALIRKLATPADPIYRYAETIEKSGQRAADLTRQLLVFARSRPLEITQIDLNEVVRETLLLMKHSLGKQISLVVNLALSPCYIEADPIQMEQVLINLCINARDAMPNGGQLTINTYHALSNQAHSPSWKIDPPTPCVVLSVCDTGLGIDEKTRARIFDPFFTTKEPGKGTGLGLAMVYGIVSQHRGHITVESEPGIGATFNVYLPALLTKNPQQQASQELALDRFRGRILIVDDEPVIRLLLQDALKEFGVTTYIAGNGQEAVQFYRTHGTPIDLVLLDMVMPEMGGRETFWQLRAIDPNVRILLMSGYSSDDTVEMLLKAGAKGFLRKPCNASELLSAVKKALEQQG
jgi:PAS domain S-box-containing protein